MRCRAGSPPGASLFGLAPCGVLRATRVATGAVRSYRTFSPLPLAAHRHSVRRYIFCATILQVTLTGRYPAHCPAEFGLSSLARAARAARATAVVWLCCDVLIIAWGKEKLVLPSPIRLLRNLVLLELLV